MSTFKSPVKWSCCFPTYCPMIYGQIVNCFLARNPRPALELVCFTLYMEIDVWKYYNELFCQSSQLKYGLSINVGLSVYCIWKICWKVSSLSFFLPEFSFKFISVWTHYLSHTDLPDFCWIEVWACSWVTIALKETNIVSQNHHKKKVKLKKTAFVDVSLPLKSGHLHCGKDNMEKVGPTKAKEPPPWTIGSLRDKRNRKYLQDSVEKLAPRNETERKITQ